MTPWIIAAFAAVGFAFLAIRAGRSCAGWAVGGGLMGLVVTILVLGLLDAPFIPYSAADQARHNTWSTVLAIVVVFVIGWFATMDLHQCHLVLRRCCRGFCQPRSGGKNEASPQPPPTSR